jgi:hypothetical protein
MKRARAEALEVAGSVRSREMGQALVDTGKK